MSSKIMAALFIIGIAALFSGCSGISQKDAEEKAIEFVKSKVKFYTKDSSQTKIISAPVASSIDSYKEGQNWVVIMHILADSGNGTKKSNILVKVDNKGNVVDFKSSGAKDVPQS